jgi:hypothetical protein
MRMRWLAVNGVVLIVAALVLHTLAPRAWPVAYFGSAVAPSDMMNPAMMQRGMMGSDMAGQDGMILTQFRGQVAIRQPAEQFWPARRQAAWRSPRLSGSAGDCRTARCSRTPRSGPPRVWQTPSRTARS